MVLFHTFTMKLFSIKLYLCVIKNVLNSVKPAETLFFIQFKVQTFEWYCSFQSSKVNSGPQDQQKYRVCCHLHRNKSLYSAYGWWPEVVTHKYWKAQDPGQSLVALHVGRLKGKLVKMLICHSQFLLAQGKQGSHSSYHSLNNCAGKVVMKTWT